MAKFYFYLWLKWAMRLTIFSIVSALFLSITITLFIYFLKGSANLNNEVVSALLDLVKFWFPIIWSLTLLLALFRSLKYIFNICIHGYELKLVECNSNEYLDVVGYGDLVKVWRKWLMLIIWLVGSQMIFALAVTYVFTTYNGVFDWFNINWLFGFILSSGYMSFIILSARCKKVKVVKC